MKLSFKEAIPTYIYSEKLYTIKITKLNFFIEQYLPIFDKLKRSLWTNTNSRL